MSTTTPVLGLTLYDSTTDQVVTFATFRAVWGGTATTSNFYKIDTWAGTINSSITSLQNQRGAISVSAVFVSANYYESTVSSIASYVTGMTILLKLDTDSNGTVTLNINSLGTKTVSKVNSAGTIVNISGGELQSNRYYLFVYDGTQWVWVDAGTSEDQIYASGSSGNIVTVGSSGMMESTLTLDTLYSGIKPSPLSTFNMKIVPSVSTNNITVSIKTFAGTDPSPSDPVYVTIGSTVRKITSALSVTKNAGTNWFNCGSSELGTKEVDYFVYLGYNSTDGIVVGFSRIPMGRVYSDFSTTSTNEKYCAISNITNATSGDSYELVGRFAATLSGAASYNWSVPTYTNSNLIQFPIYETRFLSWSPVHSRTVTNYTNFPTNHLSNYMISFRNIRLIQRHQQNASPGGSGYQRITIPFSSSLTTANYSFNESTASLMNGYTSGSTLTYYKYDGSVEVTPSEFYGTNGLYPY